MGIVNYTINDDLTVDVAGDVYLSNRNLKSILIKFNEVGDSFICSFNQLTTLEGTPDEVGGSFDCNDNQLITLEGAPNEVGGDFWCFDNQLTTLEGAPNEVGGNFYCFNNQLTTLEGAPNKVGGDLICSGNPLKSLDGKPNYVGKGFFIDSITYDRLFPPDQDKVWTLDDIDEEPVREGLIDIKDIIYAK
jgi:hypothetical protein